jgi:hypothetical protein
MAMFADNAAVVAIGETIESSTRKLQSALNKVAIWTRKWRIKLNKSKSVHIDFTNKKIGQQQSSSMVQKFHLPTQQNIFVCLLMPSYDGKSILRENMMSSTSSSRKCMGRLDAILSCQSTIKSCYATKLYIQFEVIVSSSGVVPVVLTFK